MTLRIWPKYDMSTQAIIEAPREELVITIVPYLKGDPGDAAAQFVHTQSVASATWTVNHNKGVRPLVAVFSPGWVEIEASIVHTTLNQVVVSLNTAQTGFVVCY